MAIISTPNNFFCENHFVFLGNDILIKKDCNSLITRESLPDDALLHKILGAQITGDWFAEPEKNFSAFMLEKNAPVPENWKLIPLRQLFWESRTEDTGSFIPSELASLAARAHGLLRLRELYRYCPLCGTKLTDDEKFTAKKCPSCGNQIFPRIEPAVIVLVHKGDEILLVKNKNRSREFWSCVAGFVEMGETIEQTVHREVQEETGLQIKNLRYAGSQSWPFPDQLMLAFHADYAGGEIGIQEEELDDAAWFKKESLPEIPMPGSVAFNLIRDLRD